MVCKFGFKCFCGQSDVCFSVVRLVTVAWYTMFWVKHSPFSGHVLVFGQLHFRSLLRELEVFSFLLFSPSIITATLGIQLYDSFTVFLLKILWSLLDGVKHWLMMLRNFLPICFDILVIRGVVPDDLSFSAALVGCSLWWCIVQFVCVPTVVEGFWY